MDKINVLKLNVKTKNFYFYKLIIVIIINIISCTSTIINCKIQFYEY